MGGKAANTLLLSFLPTSVTIRDVIIEWADINTETPVKNTYNAV
jgi:hypothetical protein